MQINESKRCYTTTLRSISQVLQGVIVALGLCSGVIAQPVLEQPQSKPVPALPADQSQLPVVPKDTAEKEAWHTRIVAHKLPQSGCFVASYPDSEWKASPCVKAPSRMNEPVRKKRHTGKDLVLPELTTGAGADLVAQAVGGTITSAEGSFLRTLNLQTVKSVSPSGGTTYGTFPLQLNPEPVQTYACAHATHPFSCTGWQQFLFVTSEKHAYAYMEYWLLGYGSPCPGSGSRPGCPARHPARHGQPKVMTVSSIAMRF